MALNENIVAKYLKFCLLCPQIILCLLKTNLRKLIQIDPFGCFSGKFIKLEKVLGKGIYSPNLPAVVNSPKMLAYPFSHFNGILATSKTKGITFLVKVLRNFELKNFPKKTIDFLYD